jgi:DNA-binding CsgD family transcriptional regulator
MQIGDILGIATRTANAHARSIINKLGAKNPSHVIMLGMRREG